MMCKNRLKNTRKNTNRNYEKALARALFLLARIWDKHRAHRGVCASEQEHIQMYFNVSQD